MAFTGQTPEALLTRSDSKDPATTCKGITKMGRPCRNPLDLKNMSGDNGVLAVASVIGDSDDEEDEMGAAAFFCWRHKNQAEAFAANANANAASGRETQIFPLKNRSSIDTLVQRLGVLDIDDSTPEVRQKRRRERRSQVGGSSNENTKSSNRPPRRVRRPSTWDQVQGPLMSVPSDVMKRHSQPRPQKPKKKPSFWASLCCGTADDDHVEVVRHKRRTERPLEQVSEYLSEKPSQQPSRTYQNQTPRPPKPSPTRPVPSTSTPPRKPLGEKPVRPVNKLARHDDSETSILMSYIPKSLPPQTASLLLTELSKPISPHDDEGYIYIFWLTDDTAGPAPSTTASTLLSPPSRPDQARRTSDILRQYSVRSSQPGPNRARRRSGVPPTPTAPSPSQDDETTPAKKPILLKIGRANNVHRRMNEWTRQCGFSLSLVRFYPYVPSGNTPQASPTPSPHASPSNSRRASAQRPVDLRRVSSGVRKVPHAHRVERLIHIELAAQNVRKECEACGKEHREWFEVDASREGVRRVDEVVKRWVDWAERVGGVTGE